MIQKNILFGRALVRIRSEIEKNTLIGRARTELNTLFGMALVKIRAKYRKTPFLVGPWLE